MFRDPLLRRLAGARLATVTADFALPVTVVYLVAVPLHGTATQIGLTLGAHIAGSLIVRLVGGSWTHRVPPERVLVTANLGCAGVQIAVLTLFAAHALAYPVLAALVLWRGVCAAFLGPAARSLGGTVRAPAGTRVLGLVPAGAAILGPLLGCGLVVVGGPPLALAFDVLASLVSAVLVAPVRTRRAPINRTAAGRGTGAWPAVVLLAIDLLAAGPLLTVTPVAVRGPFGYAVILAAVGFGVVAGGLFSRYLPTARVLLVAAAVGPVVLALHAPLVLVVLAFVALGVVQAVNEVRWGSAPETASLAVLPIGQVLGGFAVDRWGVPLTAWSIAVLLVAAPVLAAVRVPRPRTRRGTADIRTGLPASAASR